MASTSGRTLNITSGGKIVFHESNADGNFTASIIVDNLTDHRTIRIADGDGVLQGLEPGQGWSTTKGGTGLTLVPDWNLIVGTGNEQMRLVDAPTTHNSALIWDGVIGELTWTPINYTGLEVTTARNYLSGGTTPGLYSHKTGSQLIFKNLAAGTGITLSGQTDRVQIAVNASALSIASSQLSSVVPVSKGGTGLASIPSNALLRGTGTDTTAVISAPSVTGTVLAFDGSSVDWKYPVTQETFSGEIAYPENRVYRLSMKWNNKGTIKNIRYISNGGSCNAEFRVNGTIIGSQVFVDGTQQDMAVSHAINVSDALNLIISNVATTSVFAFSIDWERNNN